MAKELERNLGLWSVMAISVGAMVGSGIFILPALAMKQSGPAVVLAYALAGVLVTPAALSKAEMATAIPKAGGTYIYIERGMGPLLGTIAGIGTWFSLTFKSALALVGGAPYIILLFNVRPDLLAIGAAVVLIVINLAGVKQTGKMQVAIVGVMLAAMVWFVGGSGQAIQAAKFESFFAEGPSGIIAATGFVYVSYAGVTKVASVAEEVENPDRTIPIGMLGSLGFTTVLYVLIVAVIVGAAPGDGIVGSNTPVADIAETTLPEVGVLAVVLAAVLALISTANAGLLSSSRYPFAMSRDKLAPRFLKHVSDRFDTPTAAIVLTGGIMLVLIWQVPIASIAKLGSAFKIIVFMMVNLALVAFRESEVENYDPAFEDPLYPYSQAFGVLGGGVLLTQMGAIPLVGAILIIGASVLWYLLYARRRVDREGVMRGELRRRVGARSIERTKAAFAGDRSEDEVLVAVTEDVQPARERALTEVGAAVADAQDGHLTVVRFDEVPDQMPLEPAREMQTPGDVDFERRMAELEAGLNVPFDYGEIVSHDARHGVVNFCDHHDASMLVLGGKAHRSDLSLGERDVDWITRHAPCDLLVVDTESLAEDGSVALVTDRTQVTPLKILVADAIATATDTEVDLCRVDEANGSDWQQDVFEGYHDAIADLLSAPVRSVRQGDADATSVLSAVEDAGVVVVSADSPIEQLSIDDQQSSDSGVVVVESERHEEHSLFNRFTQRLPI
jgi:amino acid transporter